MAEKKLNIRLINKHDIEADWLKAVNFVPKQAEIIVYDVDENHNYERFKIGDGISAVNDLPFEATRFVNKKAEGNSVHLTLDNMQHVNVVSKIHYRQSGEGNPYAGGTGKNMLPQPQNETVFHGVTITPTDDGGIWIHGTNTETAGSPTIFQVTVSASLAAGRYYLSANNAEAASAPLRLRLLDQSGEIMGLADMEVAGKNTWMKLEYNNSRTLSAYGIRLVGGETYNTVIYPMLEKGTAATGFERYENIRPIAGVDNIGFTHNDNTYNQPLGQNVYGGTYDWGTGKLHITHGYIASYAGEALSGAWVSDRDVYTEGRIPTIGAQVVHELATPIVSEIGAANVVTSLAGANEFVGEGCDVEIDYVACIPNVINDESVGSETTWSSEKIASMLNYPEKDYEKKAEGSYVRLDCAEGDKIILDGTGEATLYHSGRNVLSGMGGNGTVYSTNGITYTVCSDGTVIMNGSTANGSYFSMMECYLPAGRYVVSASKVLYPSSRYPKISYINESGTEVTLCTLNNKIDGNFILPEGKIVSVGIYNAAGDYVCDNEVIYLQLEPSESTAPSAKEPYHGTKKTVVLPTEIRAYEGTNILYAEGIELSATAISDEKQQIRDVITEDAKAELNAMMDVCGLPILELTGDVSGMNKDDAVTLNFEYQGRAGTCTIKWQGSSSLAYPKKNYTINFDEKFEAIDPDNRYADTSDRKWGAQKKYCMKANYIDATHMRNLMGARMWASAVATRGDVSELLTASPNYGAVDGFPVMIRINGNPMGLYTFNIPKDGWMMDMGDGEQEAILCAEITGSNGTTFKGTGNLVGTDEPDFELEYVTDENNIEWVNTSLTRLVNACVQSDGTNLDAIGQYLDWNSAIDYYIFAVLLRGTDILSRNYLLSTYDGTKWFFGAYDLDSVFGLQWTGRNYRVEGNVHTTFQGFADLHRVMELIYTYKKDELIARYKELRSTVFSDAKVQNLFLDFGARIPEAAYELDRKLWPNIPSTSVGTVDQMISAFHASCEMADKELGVNNIDLESLGAYPITGGDLQGGMSAYGVNIQSPGAYPSMNFGSTSSGELKPYGKLQYDENHQMSIVQRTKDCLNEEYFSLPKPDEYANGVENYRILTSKEVVTLEQGGTNATNADAARVNLGALGVNDTAASAKILSSSGGMLSLINYDTQYGMEETHTTADGKTYAISPRVEKSDGTVKIKTVSDAGTKYHTVFTDLAPQFPNPFGGNQQLVTDANGSVYWEERLTIEEIDEICSSTVLSSSEVEL